MLITAPGACTMRPESVLACARRCPVDTIRATGHDKTKCWGHAGGACVKERFGFDGYGCGLCQTAVRCESEIPKAILRMAQK